MGWMQDVKNSVRNLRNLGKDVGKDYYQHDNNPGSGTGGSEWGVMLEFVGYSSEHFSYG
jgi:hypothetical protein